MWPYPKIVAHRGGGTLAPENTIAGLRAGLAYGFHAVEFDVMLSRDGIGMVMHDADFGRTVAGQGSVPQTDAIDLAALDAGVHGLGKKILEEAGEVWLAAEHESDEALADEISQLLYWTQVLMLSRGLSLDDVYRNL